MGSPTPARPAKRKAIEVSVSPDDRLSLYALGRSVPAKLRRDTLQFPLVTYFQDPFVAKLEPAKAFDTEAFADWEPGLNDGPTSSRFAVVDFNGDTGQLEAPAVWDPESERFVDREGRALDVSMKDAPAFHQVNVWALLQRSLALFEETLGRRIPWAFAGNRLIVVPHAGYGENAFYDRESKSLQFYYFGDPESPVYTCLSTDIVCHEFGHAVLDGIRPLFSESASVETAAFHEFFGDFCALVMTLHNNSLRRREAVETGGDFAKAATFTALAEEFGKALEGRPYLRTFRDPSTMRELAGERSPHRLSEVLSGAMYDYLIRLGERYGESKAGGKGKTPLQIYWMAADRLLRTGQQAIDLLPPADVTFRDYAVAVCRAQQLAEPLDPDGYREMLIEVFVNRAILTEEDAERLRDPQYLNDRLELRVPPRIESIAGSRASAYRFLDDNREELLIPADRDFFLPDLYDTRKRGRQNMALPRQVVLQYAWREEVPLEGKRFGKFDGQRTTMLCGGTLVFDDLGALQMWSMKPGSTPYGGKRTRTGKIAEAWEKAMAAGTERRTRLLDDLAAQIAAGRVGNITSSSKGLLGTQVPPVLAEADGDGLVQFRLTPHLHLSETKQIEDAGGRSWQISC